MVLRVNPVTLEEARALVQKGSVVAPAPDRAVLVVRGNDRQSWLNGLVTQDVSKAAKGSVAYAFLCEKKGKIVCDMHLFVRDDRIELVVPASSRASVLAALDHHLIMEDVELVESDARVFRVHGTSESRAAVLGKLASAAAPAVDFSRFPEAIVVVDEDPDAFGEKLSSALREAPGGGALLSAAREEELRVELGLPRFGVDFDTSHYPQETSLHTLGVSFSKGCYLGQEVLYMLEHRGHAKKKLVRLHAESALPTIAGGAPVPVLAEGATEVGQATSASGAWAIAMVKQAHTEADAALTLGGVACRVSPVSAG
jgi:hypothetical protein